MNQEGYTPYCGNIDGCSMPRTHFNGNQFECRECKWVSSFPIDFICEYKHKWKVGESKMGKENKIRFSDGSQLTAAMSNVLASRLGGVAVKAMSPEQSVGDSIDRGLILRRLLEEAGFEVREIQ